MRSSCLLPLVWCPCTAIHVSKCSLSRWVSSRHYNVDSSLCYYHHRGTRLNAMKRFLSLQPLFPPQTFSQFSSLSGGCSEGLQYRPSHKKPKSVSFSFLFCFREKVENFLAIPLQIQQIRGTRLGSFLIKKNLSLVFLQPNRVFYERAIAVDAFRVFKEKSERI